MPHQVFHIMILKRGKKPKAEENNGIFHALPFTSKEDNTQVGIGNYKFSCTKGLLFAPSASKTLIYWIQLSKAVSNPSAIKGYFQNKLINQNTKAISVGD